MRKLVAALTLSTSALAVTCVYLWTELRDARGQLRVQHGLESAKAPSAVSTQLPFGLDETKASPKIATRSPSLMAAS